MTSTVHWEIQAQADREAIFRYLYLVQVKHAGGEPEEILLSDRPLQMALFLWALVVVAVFYLS